MKAIILAAGLGTRMRPLTLSTPKPLLKIADKALIEYHIERLARAGFRDIVINHAWLGEQIVSYLGDGRRYGVRIEYSAESSPLETAGGIVKALPLLIDSPNDCFVVVNADVFSNYDFANLPEKLTGLAHLVLVDNPEHNLEGDFALVSESIASEKQLNYPAYTFSGISVLSGLLFAGLDKDAGPLAPLLRQAINERKVSAEHFSGYWRDIGTPERLNQVDNAVKEQRINGL